MRTVFVLLSASLILVPSALPQVPLPNTVTPRSSQPPSVTNPAMLEALKQFSGSGFAQDPAVPSQQPRRYVPKPPQISPWTGPFATIGPYGNGLDLGIRRQELVGKMPDASKVCSIPLLEAPADGSIDQGIRLPKALGSPSPSDPGIALMPPAPACEAQIAPQPKRKAK
jgi:hypothetical protein